ncbi:threonine/serine exporter ThrE family protein [Yimella sp. cx-51]|uniref:threonine/serine ThrE exporter family protein n=1 Tax=Yimella sp. cx-51 TaxID=2770551 RepID=UPI00165E90F8|nr:threonine/serine exporter family protein [Yimella sp. cx-51]MBC9955808.1 threonine/serine exporter family protein [Yimella sp. cx-51]QTH37639.1 threonine/serine exporter family protein [Yimella sp. cx-51]
MTEQRPREYSDHRRRLPPGATPRDLGQRAKRAIAGGRPTVPIGLRGQEGGPSDSHTRLVIDLGLRVGEALLATGASAADVTNSVLRLTKAYGVHSLHVDVTYSSITVSHHRGVLRDPITVMRIVPVMQQDFTRLERLQGLVRDGEEGQLEITDAHDRLDEITTAEHPYSRMMVVLAAALLGGAVAALLGGEWPLVLLSAITTAVVDRAVRRLGRIGVPPFFAQAFGAAIPTSVAVLINLLGNNLGIEIFKDLKPSVVVASGVVVLLAGLAAVGAAQDTIDGFYITAAGRTFEVLILSGGIVAGVLGVLALAQQVGINLQISPSLSFSTSPGVGLIASAAITCSFALSSYSGPRTIAVATAIGTFAYAVYALLTGWGTSVPWAAGFAALLIGAGATLLGWRLRVPSLAIATAAIVPLLPGLTVYRGVFELVDRRWDPAQGGATLFGAVLIGLAIASGVTLGSLPGRMSRPSMLTRRRTKMLTEHLPD